MKREEAPQSTTTRPCDRRQTDRQTGRRTDRQTDRQTDAALTPPETPPPPTADLPYQLQPRRRTGRPSTYFASPHVLQSRHARPGPAHRIHVPDPTGPQGHPRRVLPLVTGLAAAWLGRACHIAGAVPAGLACPPTTAPPTRYHSGTAYAAAMAQDKDKDKENLWQALLREVAASRGVDTRNVVVLGQDPTLCVRGASVTRLSPADPPGGPG